MTDDNTSFREQDVPIHVRYYVAGKLAVEKKRITTLETQMKIVGAVGSALLGAVVGILFMDLGG